MADKYDPIGICIYCGKTSDQTKLKDEHIVPLNLNGASYYLRQVVVIAKKGHLHLKAALLAKCINRSVW
jgi:hypothetical protein